MLLIESYIKKATEGRGFHTLPATDADELSQLSIIAERFEDEVLKIMPLPVTINAVVQHKIDEMKITQAKLAEMLGLGKSKLSQILNGKREPDVSFLKAVHSKLGINGDFCWRIRNIPPPGRACGANTACKRLCLRNSIIHPLFL